MRDFNDATPDSFIYALNSIAQSLDNVSVFAQLNLDKVAQYGRHFHLSNNSNDNDTLLMNWDDSWGWALRASWSTTDGVWSIAKPSTGVAVNIGFTYSYSSTANDPVIYLNGVAQGITERQTPAGTKMNAFTHLKIGGNDPWTSSITLGSMNGREANFAIWNRLLTANEMAALGKNFAPSRFRNGLVMHNRLSGRLTNEPDYIRGVSASSIEGSPGYSASPVIRY